MANKLTHAAARSAFEAVLHTAGRKAIANADEGFVPVIDAIQKLNGDTWPPEAYDRLRKTFSKGGKYQEFFADLLKRVDVDYLEGLIMAFGFEAGFTGYRETRKSAKKLGVSVPWVILFDPTSACNLHCIGCWSAEYGHQLNLSYEDMDRIVTEGKALGVHGYVMTGGEPTTRAKDVFKLAKKHKDCGFMLYTNGTLVDQWFCDQMRECKNIVLSMSIEGMEESTDARRGNGVFNKVMNAMDLLRKNGLVYGTSICYTSQNYKNVTSDEFLDFLISKGVTFSWYFHFMPTGMDTTMDLVLTPEQREYMYHRIREIRGYEGGKKIFTIDFQNDGEFVGGCIAGGKDYCHINPNGDMEPCVFIHYSSANIHNMSLAECLQQPLFKLYQKNQPFNTNLLQPCPFLENPDKLRDMVHASGAKSTDLSEPESVDHLTDKVQDYAKAWAPTAEKLWKSNHPDFEETITTL